MKPKLLPQPEEGKKINWRGGACVCEGIGVGRRKEAPRLTLGRDMVNKPPDWWWRDHGMRSEPWLVGTSRNSRFLWIELRDRMALWKGKSIVDPGVKEALWWTAVSREVRAVPLEGRDLGTRPQIWWHQTIFHISHEKKVTDFITGVFDGDANIDWTAG